MGKMTYTKQGAVMDMGSKRLFVTAPTEGAARFTAACINACDGLELDRIEVFKALPMFLECQRLRELVSQQRVQIETQAELIHGYESALKAQPDAATLAEMERTGW